MVRAPAICFDRVRSSGPRRLASAPTPRAASACALLLTSLLGGCLFARPQPGVQLSSSPAGARVSVDGEFSGFVTPAHIDLATDQWHLVAVELDGYEPQIRMIGPGSRIVAADWRHASIGAIGTFRFPLFLPIEDLVPFTYEARNEPQRIHFHLSRGRD